MTSDVTIAEIREKPKKRKLLIPFVIIVAAVLCIAAAILVFSLMDSSPEPTQEELIASFYEKNKSYFVTPDFEKTPSDDLEYMNGYDRSFYFEEGGITVDLKEADRETYPGLDTVCCLIEASMAGDKDAYNTLFTERYLNEKGRQAAFTGQKLYRIKIATGGEQNGTYYYTVTYAIKDNDATLRRDIVSDAERDMVLTVKLVDSVYRIDGMSFRFRY